MKKAFSVTELIFALSLASLVFVAIFKGFGTFQKSSKINDSARIELASSLVLMSQILKNCLEFSFVKDEILCLLEDRANTFVMQAKTLFLGSSGLVLKTLNNEFYAPKAHFIFEVVKQEKDKNITLQMGVLQNEQDLRSSASNTLYLYKNKQIYLAKPLDKERLSFENKAFTGFYKLVLARVKFYLKNNKLYYSFQMPEDKVFESILQDEISSLEASFNAPFLELKLCLKNDFCLQKALINETL